MRQAFLFTLVFAAVLPAQAGDGKDDPRTVQAPPPDWMQIPPAPALTAAEELATFTVHSGYRVELVASDDLVQDPVAIQFGPDGRMWVVEMRGFMPNVDGVGEDAPIGDIAVLTDTDGDGRMDRRNVFVDELVLPRGIILVDDGALVLSPPNFVFCRDADGDGRADEREVLGETFPNGIDSPEHAANSPVRGLDNWIYFARYHLRLRRIDGRQEWQRVVPGGQWGLTRDPRGRLLFNTNSDVLRAHLAPPHYGARNPALSRPAFADQGTTRDQSVWPSRITPGVNRGYRKGTLRADGTLARFTACCAPWVYRGDLMPEFRGDAFIAEPSANLVRRSVLDDDGPRVRSRNAYEKSEFLTSTDERFRPVNLCGGPDGALYIVDMYRGILQHRQFVTTYLRRQIIERKLDQHVHLGRVWRVVPDGARRRGREDLAAADTAALVESLESPNGWRADTAQRLLVERRDPRSAPPLRELAQLGDAPEARVAALWTLDGIGGLRRSVLTHALRDPDEFVREQAVRLCEPRLRGSANSILLGMLTRLVRDPSPRVRLQLAFTLGAVPSSDPRTRRIADSASIELVVRDGDDAVVRDAVLTGLGGREGAFLTAVQADPRFDTASAAASALLRRLASCVFRGRDPHAKARLIDRIALEAVEWRRAALLEGVVGALPKRGARKARVAGKPAGFEVLAAMADDVTAQDAVARLRESVEWAAADAGRRVLAAPDQALFERGRLLYARECTTCHQADGRGLGGLAPPLSGSEWALGSEARLVRIVLHGLEGPVEVAGRRYELAAMPEHARLTDVEIASVLTFVRLSWENDAGPVQPRSVRAIRAAESRRSARWTADELMRH